MMSVPDENLREVGFHRFWCAERSCQLLDRELPFITSNFSYTLRCGHSGKKFSAIAPARQCAG